MSPTAFRFGLIWYNVPVLLIFISSHNGIQVPMEGFGGINPERPRVVPPVTETTPPEPPPRKREPSVSPELSDSETHIDTEVLADQLEADTKFYPTYDRHGRLTKADLDHHDLDERI